MPRVARLIRDAVTEVRPADQISQEVGQWMGNLGPLRFSFDDRLGLQA
jgi:hypothetical protein